jgi:L-threonylcarbamoyladenylate synthase
MKKHTVSASSIAPATPDNLSRAATLLADGRLVAFPTETVYGLGADADNPTALAKIFAAKGRPANHPLIVHVASLAEVAYWTSSLPNDAVTLFERFSPGPLTLILPKAPHVNDAVTGGQTTVGVRIPSHPVAHELLTRFTEIGGHGIAAPSANRFGHVSPTTASHVAADLDGKVDLILDGGATTHGIESTIVALTDDTPVLLRPGSVTVAALEAALGKKIALGKHGKDTPRASGTLPSHYAPHTAARLVPACDLDKTLAQHRLNHERVALLLRASPFRANATEPVIRLPMDAEGYAQGLYAALRQLDAAHADILLIEAVPDAPEWLGVRDRLARATYQKV